MSTLREHIQNQQNMACNLVGVLEALAILDNEGMGKGGAVTSLISVALVMASDINEGLDTVNLPKGGAQ
ncbi:hypothetical protein [Paenirhodobacter populi]|uniref:Uncharacterized protein n=1 Tax=Paenirhodobacter populi TaxID=2306993 RepID=A0A443IQC2_9RHOB|nr:hypothetical protein [Sinirhodobacter populi]RWR08493.1 hypothetical protein D2T33_15470 [Sinirhodobacter populi]